MEIQVQIPKIKLTRSGGKSHSPTSHHGGSRRKDSQGRISIKHLQTDRFDDTFSEKSQFSPNSTKKSTRVLHSISSPLGKPGHTRHVSALPLSTQKSMPSKISKDKDMRPIDENLEGEKGEISSVNDSNIANTDKVEVSALYHEKLVDKTTTDQMDPSMNKIPENAPDAFKELGLSRKMASELHSLVQKKKFQRVLASVMKKAFDLDELAEEELIELAIQIIKKPPAKRLMNEIKVLAKCMSNIDFFKGYDESTTEACLKHMYYVNMQSNDIVFEAGTVGTNFWVIVKGSVSVIVDVPKVVGQDDKGEDIIEKVPTEVRTLPSGSAFGELALMNSRPRAATIICREICEFAVLEKGPFKEILNEKVKKNLWVQLDFLSSVPAFKMVPYHIVHWLHFNVELTKRTRGQVVYEQGDIYDGIYVIKSGEFKILKTVDESEEVELFVKGATDKMRIKPNNKKTIELAILCSKEIFGEEEALTVNNLKRRYSVVCHSPQAEIWEIPREAVEKKLLVFSAMRNWLTNYVIGKENHYNNRLKTIREARSEQKPGIPYHLDKPRGSPLRNYDPATTDYSKQWETSESGISPKHLKKSDSGTSLAEKKKAFIAMQGKYASPQKIQIRGSQEIQDVKRERGASDDTKRRLTLKPGEPIDYHNNRLSLMRVNLDRLNAKKRLSRRCESLSKRPALSPKRYAEECSSTRLVKGKSGEELLSSTLNSSTYKTISATNDSRLNPVSSMYVKFMDQTLETPVLEGVPRRKMLITDRPVYEKVAAKKHIGTLDNIKADIQTNLSEMKFTSMLYNKTITKMSVETKAFDNRSMMSVPSQSFFGPRADDNDDTRTYLLNKLNSKVVPYFGSKGDPDVSGNTLKEEGLSSSQLSRMSSTTHLKFKDVEKRSPNLDLKLRRTATEVVEESLSRIHSKEGQTPTLRKTKREL